MVEIMKEHKRKKIDLIVDRGVIVKAFPSIGEFKERLLRERLRFYIGADPTSSALHLSHAKNYMLLEEFRLLGHEVIVLFGDFTARIGDPTDRDSARKQLTEEQVRENVNGWIDQIRPLMDFDAKENPPRILYNNDWLAKLTMKDVVNLASNMTVQRMLERDMFEKRMKENKPIFLHEFLYPLMQGYDSVAMGVDVELCGTDQIFNALVGRVLAKRYNDKDKLVVAVNLMENPKTGELMSKSRNTGVFLNLSPFDMYGAIMAQPDEMIRVLLVNNTRLPIDRVEEIVTMSNPRDAKMITAQEIVKLFHGLEKAEEAQEQFIKLVQKKEPTDKIPEKKIGNSSASVQDILRVCFEVNISSSYIRRLISQKAIKIEGIVKDNFQETINIPTKGLLIAAGKKKWFRVFP